MHGTVAPQNVVDDLTDADFHFFREAVHRLAGIHLSEAKRNLVASRLRTHLRQTGQGTYSDYRRYLSGLKPSHPEWQTFVNLLTTNKTEFFREADHFDYLADVARNSRSEFKIWSCASSTGQEPYTLAMILDRHLPSGTAYRVLATDIDTQVLAKGANGVYPHAKLSEIPAEYRTGTVELGKGEVNGWFRIADRIRDHIVFKHHNLNEATYPGDEVFDVIFCRNVLIYFAPDTIRALMQKLHKSLKKDGLLFISHSESISNCQDLFRQEKASIYRKVSDG